MKTTKKLFTMLTAAAMTAAMTAAPISAAEVPALEKAGAKTGMGNIFLTFRALENFAGIIKGDKEYTITANTEDGEDVVVTVKDENVNIAAEGEDLNGNVEYSVSVDAAASADTELKIEDELNGAEVSSYIIKTENGKTLASADKGKTWTEVKTTIVPEPEAQ